MAVVRAKGSTRVSKKVRSNLKRFANVLGENRDSKELSGRSFRRLLKGLWKLRGSFGRILWISMELLAAKVLKFLMFSKVFCNASSASEDLQELSMLITTHQGRLQDVENKTRLETGKLLYC